MEDRGFVLRNGLYDFQGCITIFPKDYFCPKSYDTGELHITKNTYTIHHFAGSWIKKYPLWLSIIWKYTPHGLRSISRSIFKLRK